MERTVAWTAVAITCLGLFGGLVSGPAAADDPSLQGHWEGVIEIPGTALDFDLDFALEEGSWVGDISIPAQMARDLPLGRISLDGRSARFEILDVPGEPTFEGEVSADGATLEGTFSQAGQQFPFSASSASRPADRVRAALAGLDEIIDQALIDFEVPGLGLAIVVDGEVVLAEGYGVRDLESGEPVTADTLFAIGSCTKAFTTFLLGTLVDEGVLDWDEPVISYLPWFRMQDDHATRELTVRDLVTHRSGLPRHDLLWYNASHSREELVRRLRHLQPFADLRERYHYQNLMYLTAGYLAEQVTGRSWEELISERIFEPLGMERSNFSVLASQGDDDHASPHAERDDELQPIPFRDITMIGPAGSINSSVAEMAKWLRMLAAEGEADGVRLAGSDSIREIFTPQTVMGGYPADPDVLLTTYGLGWVLGSYRGHYRAVHGGGIDGFVAMTTIMPLEGIGVVALSNRSGQELTELVSRVVLDRSLELQTRDWIAEGLQRTQAAEDIADAADDKKEAARKPDTEPSRALAEYAGEYEHPGYGITAVGLEGGVLHMSYNDISSPLEHWHYDTFNATGESEDPALEGTKLLFRSDVSGEITELVVTLEPEADAVVFRRLPDAAMFDPEFLELFTGRYSLGPQSIEIILKGDSLVARISGQPSYELEPIRGTEFGLAGLSGFSIVFVMDGDTVRELEIRQPNGVFTATPSPAEDE